MTLTKAIKTFSHALGTLRMGENPTTSPVDEKGRFRGIDNLYIADGSVFPTSGGVNPSLTIAANALRVAYGLLE
jgi:choline dehydrogenase-like flavoprotein